MRLPSLPIAPALVRQPGATHGWRVAGATVASVAIALALSAGLIAWTGDSPIASARAIYDGSVASQDAWTTTLLYVAPLLLVAVGLIISYVHVVVSALVLVFFFGVVLAILAAIFHAAATGG